VNLPGYRFDVGKRIGEADGPSGNGSSDIEKRKAQGGAAAFVHADMPG
jgi:hypothetical protein